MVLDNYPGLDLVFHALAHPARRAIVRQLASGERTLTQLASPLKMTFPAATKHVRVLEKARLLRRRVVGREHRCSLSAAPLQHATLWTEQFRRHWEARFQALDSLLEEMKSSDDTAPSHSRSAKPRHLSERPSNPVARAARASTPKAPASRTPSLRTLKSRALAPRPSAPSPSTPRSAPRPKPRSKRPRNTP